jgi:AP-4 complex subunit mu-1
MISQFFVLSPRGDTIIAKRYRNDRSDSGAHERSHTEAFFRKIKFWNDDVDDDGILGVDSASALDTDGGSSSNNTDSNKTSTGGEDKKTLGDAPPVFLMPDGLTYMHVKRNGLIFGCATARNVSAVTVVEVREIERS